jgi:hypothetical protein
LTSDSSASTAQPPRPSRRPSSSPSNWPFLPREGEGVEILEDCDAQVVDSVGYGADGSALVHLGRVVLDDLQVKQLRRRGGEWRGYREAVSGAISLTGPFLARTG